MRLYLAHPVLSREDIRRHEQMVEEHLGIELFNPFYDGDEAEAIRPLDEGKITIQQYADRLNENGKGREFVKKDLRNVERLDGVVAVIYRGTPTIGTSMEIMHAVHIGKPVFFVTNFPEHIWVQYAAKETGGFIVSTWTELEEKLAEKYGLAIKRNGNGKANGK